MLPTMRNFTDRFAAFRAGQGFAAPAKTEDSKKAAPQDPSEVAPLRPRVEIPICDRAPDAQAREKAFCRGQFLARQDCWEELTEEMNKAEAARELTPGLASVAQILAKGARSDMTHAARIAIAKGQPKNVNASLSAFAANLEDMPDSPAMGYIMAMAHVDVAQLWRGASQARDLAPQRREAFDSQLRAATALADQFDPFELSSPLWAQVRCAVLDGDPHPAQRVSDDYEDLIDLDPQNPTHLMALGRDLLPRRFGMLETLDDQARRKVSQLNDVWGTGAYTWVYIGALQSDPAALRRIDPELFVEGLHDILGRYPSQDMANRLAAFTGLTIAAPCEAGSARARLMECFNWILQDHMRELHPLIWAAAPVPGKPEIEQGDTAYLTELGRTRAIGTIAQHFAPALDAGRRLVFTPDGLQLRKGD
ncbi:hypothetical protein [Pelagimonas varians]|uniref:Uncharacterized protein n=1 Tax=Pelagimonas varians TaxID=696760 RepID=A0A238KE24_9RHOB|nr:hypothetical protein [Pelagimonas varians]PYG29932.1 hypothetical protein C8N36_10798 [Pelagimonas varians]SMX40724.1 hypothetical protein PEV8663_02097 [Pelagimonas varians]